MYGKNAAFANERIIYANEDSISWHLDLGGKKKFYEVSPGELITVETVNAFGVEAKKVKELETAMRSGFHHPVTGPLCLKGLKAGETLKVDISNIDLKQWVYQCNSRSSGILRGVFSGRNFKKSRVCGKYLFYEGHVLKTSPNVGVVGVANSEQNRTGRCGAFGGNLDIKYLQEGATVFLPTCVDGGMLYLGDVHAYQGTGELSGIALECSAFVKVALDKAEIKINCPVILHEDYIYTVGFGETVNDAMVIAIQEMVNIISIQRDIRPIDAYQMVGAFGDGIIGHMTGKVVTVAVRMQVNLTGFLGDI